MTLEGVEVGEGGGARRGRISHLPSVSQRVTLEDEDDRYTAVLRWIQKE